MDQPKRGWTDEQMEQVVGNLLRIGVAVAALVVLAGGVLYLIRFGSALPHYAVFSGEPSDLCSVSGTIRDVLSLHIRAVIQLGLLILIATPIARVAFSILAFALQRDRIYVLVTFLVLGVLIYSLIGGGL